MEKEIFINAYTKRDGTHVREHYRTINSDGLVGNPTYNGPVFNEYEGGRGDVMYMGATPVLQGGVSMNTLPWGKIGEVAGEVLSTAIEVGSKLLPIASGIYSAINSNNAAVIEKLKPQFNDGVKLLDMQIEQMKQHMDTSVKELLKIKDQIEYSKQYEKFKKEYSLYKSTTNLASSLKINARSGNYEKIAHDIKGYTQDLSDKRGIKDIILPFDKVQNNIENMRHDIDAYLNTQNSNATKADFSKFEDKFEVKLNNKINANRSDARELANLFLVKTNNAPLSQDYQVISSKYNNIINYDYELKGTNKEIPSDWNGVIYSKYSPMAKHIANSPELQNQIKSQFDYNAGVFKSNKLEVNFSTDENLHLAFGHATVLQPYIDEEGCFHGILFDKYDFDLQYYAGYYKNPKIYFANDYFWLIQKLGGHNFYILVPIMFKW